MQTLAIKYRPKMFEDVVEQGPIRLILQEQIRTQTFKNCYLFTGGAGTGKTTCARIFASELNDHKGNAIEIDAASNNGVDNVREIIDNAKFKALDAPYKVYIMDEVHMLSTGAWNAMLKLIEEPPAKTIFIFCTTDPQKIPATILSRVQRYDFRRITYDGIVARLTYIMQQEHDEAYDKLLKEDGDMATCEAEGSGYYQWQPEALEYIAKMADGGMRDAITLLDKCISYSNEVTVESVVEALGTTNYDTMVSLTNHILAMDAAKAVVVIEDCHRQGVDLKQFIKQYTWFLVDAYKYCLLQDFEYITLPPSLHNWLEILSREAIGFTLYLMNRMVKLNSQIKWESTPKPLIEATVILLCQEEPTE